jgi:5'-nucleotidase
MRYNSESYGMPTILLTNDDGIQSIGLLALKKRMEKLGDVVVVAPRDERSGVGKALTTKQIKLVETRLADGSSAYATTGTPADAFLLATNKIMRHPPELLMAGINLGPNLGIDDLLNSGTLGAALEAAIHEVPAIAVSYCIQKITDRQVEKKKIIMRELKLPAALAEKAAEYVLDYGMPRDVDIISINVPERAESREVEITSLSYKGYGDIHTNQEDGFEIASWALSSYPDDQPGTDLHAIREKRRISITPIKIQLLHNKKGLEGFSKFLVS